MRHLASHLALFFVVVTAVACPQEAPKAVPVAVPAAPAPPVDPHAGHDMAKPGTPAPTSTKSVSFIWPHDGSTVFTEFDVAFGVNGMGLRKALEDPLDKTTGHHHIIIDGASVPAGQVVPKDATHIHYGDASSTAHLTVTPGPHVLEMQLADGAHLSYGPELAAKIKITAKEKPAAMGVSFANLKDGDVVTSPVVVKFGVEGFTVRPASEDVLDKTSGHHHLTIDGGPDPLGAVVAKDATHLHFGKGETEASVPLTPGPHTLTMQFADGAHFSYGPPMSKTIKVTVK
ncbi:MAG: DUF4399 domain-containing protein [Deltaproteobacteria bacterium]|nr:DUF4399 domain-containing protein [Deltaproteobacteria bacterium]